MASYSQLRDRYATGCRDPLRILPIYRSRGGSKPLERIYPLTTARISKWVPEAGFRDFCNKYPQQRTTKNAVVKAKKNFLDQLPISALTRLHPSLISDFLEPPSPRWKCLPCVLRANLPGPYVSRSIPAGPCPPKVPRLLIRPYISENRTQALLPFDRTIRAVPRPLPLVRRPLRNEGLLYRNPFLEERRILWNPYIGKRIYSDNPYLQRDFALRAAPNPLYSRRPHPASRAKIPPRTCPKVIWDPDPDLRKLLIKMALERARDKLLASEDRTPLAAITYRDNEPNTQRAITWLSAETSSLQDRRLIPMDGNSDVCRALIRNAMITSQNVLVKMHPKNFVMPSLENATAGETSSSTKSTHFSSTFSNSSVVKSQRNFKDRLFPDFHCI